MWLLETTTLELCEFLPTKVPPYAILSHTWGDEEVSFHDIQKPPSKRLQGYQKIKSCCALAKSHTYEWVWIDTCCIDKKSSAELSEAINSMFQWYKDSRICYVYMSDVSYDHVGESRPGWTFENSRWFRRGWTLQELLAPENVKFYDSDWRYLGDILNLCGKICRITGVGRAYLLHNLPITSASIAARMSWASRRSTTRPEDEAYCLMGIFDVNLPLLYGEGTKAFRRLQEEIVRTSDDESLFAWNAPARDQLTGIFAPNPACFMDCGQVFALSFDGSGRPPYFMTNRGIRAEIFCRSISRDQLEYHDGWAGFVAARGYELLQCQLNCALSEDGSGGMFIILRSSLQSILGIGDTFSRLHTRVKPGHESEDIQRVRKVYIRDPPK